MDIDDHDDEENHERSWSLTARQREKFRHVCLVALTLIHGAGQEDLWEASSDGQEPREGRGVPCCFLAAWGQDSAGWKGAEREPRFDPHSEFHKNEVAMDGLDLSLSLKNQLTQINEQMVLLQDEKKVSSVRTLWTFSRDILIHVMSLIQRFKRRLLQSGKSVLKGTLCVLIAGQGVAGAP